MVCLRCGSSYLEEPSDFCRGRNTSGLRLRMAGSGVLYQWTNQTYGRQVIFPWTSRSLDLSRPFFSIHPNGTIHRPGIHCIHFRTLKLLGVLSSPCFLLLMQGTCFHFPEKNTRGHRMEAPAMKLDRGDRRTADTRRSF